MNRAFTLLARSKIPQEGNLLSKNSRSQPHREGPAPISYRVLQVGHSNSTNITPFPHTTCQIHSSDCPPPRAIAQVSRYPKCRSPRSPYPANHSPPTAPTPTNPPAPPPQTPSPA